MSVHQQLQTALLELEAAMKAANLWRTPTPDAAAFASQQPFCIDTMSLPQWVRPSSFMRMLCDVTDSIFNVSRASLTRLG